MNILRKFFLGKNNFKKPILVTAEKSYGGEGGGGSAIPEGVMKILSISYSFVYFYFLGFYENLKTKIPRTTLNTCYTIVLHQIVT